MQLKILETHPWGNLACDSISLVKAELTFFCLNLYYCLLICSGLLLLGRKAKNISNLQKLSSSQPIKAYCATTTAPGYKAQPILFSSAQGPQTWVSGLEEKRKSLGSLIIGPWYIFFIHMHTQYEHNVQGFESICNSHFAEATRCEPQYLDARLTLRSVKERCDISATRKLRPAPKEKVQQILSS